MERNKSILRIDFFCYCYSTSYTDASQEEVFVYSILPQPSGKSAMYLSVP